MWSEVISTQQWDLSTHFCSTITPYHAACQPPRKNATQTDRHGRDLKVFFAHARAWRTPKNICISVMDDLNRYFKILRTQEETYGTCWVILKFFLLEMLREREGERNKIFSTRKRWQHLEEGGGWGGGRKHIEEYKHAEKDIDRLEMGWTQILGPSPLTSATPSNSKTGDMCWISWRRRRRN
jgi:hypothetical protein